MKQLFRKLVKFIFPTQNLRLRQVHLVVYVINNKTPNDTYGLNHKMGHIKPFTIIVGLHHVIYISFLSFKLSKPPRMWYNGKALRGISKRTRVRIPKGTNILEVDLCISCASDLPSRWIRKKDCLPPGLVRWSPNTWIIKKIQTN